MSVYVFWYATKIKHKKTTIKNKLLKNSQMMRHSRIVQMKD